MYNYLGNRDVFPKILFKQFHFSFVFDVRNKITGFWEWPIFSKQLKAGHVFVQHINMKLDGIPKIVYKFAECNSMKCK